MHDVIFVVVFHKFQKCETIISQWESAKEPIIFDVSDPIPEAFVFTLAVSIEEIDK
jgi:hypothetical protein